VTILVEFICACIFTVVDEGFFKLWKGLSPALYRHYSEYVLYDMCFICDNMML